MTARKLLAGKPTAGGGGLVVTDDFNRSNDTTLGANWTALSGATMPYIVSNAAEGSSGGNSVDHAAYWSADTFSNDQYVEADVTLGSSYSSGWISVRCQSGANSYYTMVWDNDPGGKYYLGKVTAGSYSDFSGSPATSVGTSGTVTLRLEVSGTSLECFANSVSILTATDSSFSSGSPGLAIFYSSGTTAIVDNWEGGDL